MSRISDLAGFTTALSTTQDLSVGVITATSFSGDGSGLTGVASTDNIQTATDAKFLANVNITGITTATGGFVGALTGDATGLSGTPNITVGSVTAASGSFSGNVTIGGTLTYQDVTNIDSIGIITAQQGIQVLANGVDVTGIGTFEDRLTYDGSLGQAGGGTVTYTVTVASKDSTHRYNGQGSGNGYVIDNLQAPVLTLTPGRTYRFTNDNTGSHPLKFYYDANKTTLYETGVTFDNAYTEITVSDTTPAVLHYQCTNHSLMGNSVITQSNPIVGAGITLNGNGGGVHVTGVVTATSFSGSGANLTGIDAAPSFSGIASGSISNGDAVTITSDGKLSSVSGSSVALSIGATSQYNANARSGDSVYNTSANKTISAFVDNTGGQNYAKAFATTVSGTTVSFGSITNFDTSQSASAGEKMSLAYDSNADRVFILYERDTDIYGCVASYTSGLNFGSPTLISSYNPNYLNAVYDSNAQKILICFENDNQSDRGQAAVVTISNLSFSVGSFYDFFDSTDSVGYVKAAYDESAQKTLIAFTDEGNGSYGACAIATISGTAISYSDKQVFAGANSNPRAVVYDPSKEKLVIIFNGGDNFLYAVVGQISNNTFVHGERVKVSSKIPSTATGNTSAVYDSGSDKIVVVFRDSSQNDGNVVVGTVSDIENTITFAEADKLSNANMNTLGLVSDPDQKKVVAHFSDDSSNGVALAFQPPYSATNLTSQNFLGFSDAAYSNGDTAKVQLGGAIDDAQSGLTTARKHYVQYDGSLSTTPDTPSVLGGTAVSATKIVIKE